MVRKFSLLIVGCILLLLLILTGQHLLRQDDIQQEEIPADVDIPVVVRVKGGMLEVVQVMGRRAFPKSTDPKILGQSFSYCREKASWTVPYKITYRLKLGELWPLRYQNGTLFARVPELSPSLPVAIDTRGLVKGPEESCWFVPDMGTRTRALKSISPKLAELAKSKNTKKFAREQARATVTEFLRTWAMSQRDYRNIAPDSKIVVLFPGE